MNMIVRFKEGWKRRRKRRIYYTGLGGLRNTSIIQCIAILCSCILLLSSSFVRINDDDDDGKNNFCFTSFPNAALAFGTTNSFFVRHVRNPIAKPSTTWLKLSQKQDQSQSFIHNNIYDQEDDYFIISKEDLHFQIQNWFTLNQQQSDYGRTSILSYQKKLLKQVNEMHARDVSFCSSILFPEKQLHMDESIDYEWVNINLNHKYDPDSLIFMQQQQQQQQQQQHYTDYLNTNIRLAAKTKSRLCSLACVQLIREAADFKWRSEGKTSSFSYQRKGNYEAHLHDLCKSNKDLQHAMNQALQNSIYPWVRKAFRDSIPELASSSSDDYKLAIYDALVIRYNATEALDDSSHNDILVDGVKRNRKKGAGQPLHRDLGLISVNIMLNSESEFVGGGTCFDLQYDPNFMDQQYKHTSLKPDDVGYALAHLSSHRHAGSCITQGVREILVLFLTAQKPKKSCQNDNHYSNNDAPTFEKVSRLKKTANERNIKKIQNMDQTSCPTSSHRRVHHYFLATKLSPNDGEAWHYLGMSLKDHSSSNKDPKKKHDTLILALKCLQHATILIPCDARLYNNLGLVYQQFTQVSHAKVRSSFQRSMELHEWSDRAGCDVEDDYDAACLNFGLFLSYLVDEEYSIEKKIILWQNCIQVLRTRFSPYQTVAETDGTGSSIKLSGSKLLIFCEQQQRALMLQK